MSLTVGNAYRIWDETLKLWLTQAYVAQSGNVYYRPTRGNVEETVPMAHVRVEYATGYLDVEGKMIFQGDIVFHDRDETMYNVIWGEFDDCCVKGEAWQLQDCEWQECLGYWCDNEYDGGRHLTVVGNIHEGQSIDPTD